jgi:hypothetical protein
MLAIGRRSDIVPDGREFSEEIPRTSGSDGTMILSDAGMVLHGRRGDPRRVGLARGSTHPTRITEIVVWVRLVEWLDRPIGFVLPSDGSGQLGSSWQMALFALLLSTLVGCGSTGDPPLIVATTWSVTERTQIEAVVHESGDRRPIAWITLAPGERLETVVDRRGEVDILLGAPLSALDRLGSAGRLDGTNPISTFQWGGNRPPSAEITQPTQPSGDPRIDPNALALAKETLRVEGWPKGYGGMVRAAARPGPIVGGANPPFRSECVALVRGGPNPARATQFFQILQSRGLAQAPPSSVWEDVRSDDLLADLLGAALVDALDELREADSALARFGHPARAEAAIGDRPPWPPASVAKLLADPNGPAMVETLLEQVAPDPDSRAWLVESWSRPKRPIDGALLAELAGAVDGRLAREPRFRAWLRGEWTAWTRQLYRRVARVAGGYVPS